MPVYRYHSVEEMPPPAAGDPSDPKFRQRVAELWRFSTRALPGLFAPGVYRYRSIEEADDAREAATLERMRRLAKRTTPSR